MLARLLTHICVTRPQWVKMGLESRQSLVKIMVGRLFGAKSFFEPMLIYCQFGPLGANFSDIQIKIPRFSFGKMHVAAILSLLKCVKWIQTDPGERFRKDIIYLVPWEHFSRTCDYYGSVTLHLMRLMSSATQLCFQMVIQVNNKETTKVLHYWPFVSGIHR